MTSISRMISPNTNIMTLENRRNSDAEISMLPSPSETSPTPLTTPKKSFTSRNRRFSIPGKSVLGFKFSNLILTLAVGVIIIIEIMIMYETTRTYNESLVNQLSQKNAILENSLLNLTKSHTDRNRLLSDLFRLNQVLQDEVNNRTGKIEDKIDEIQLQITQLSKENKEMYATGEKNFMETLQLVRDALTMNTNTVIRLLDDNNEIRQKLHRLEESVANSVSSIQPKWNPSRFSTSAATRVDITSFLNSLSWTFVAIFIGIFTA